MIRKLYAIEKNAREQKFDTEKIYIERQEKSKPLITKFRSWLLKKSPKAPPKSLLGKAISYTLIGKAIPSRVKKVASISPQ